MIATGLEQGSASSVMAVFGPTRMNYRRNIQALLQGAAHIAYLLKQNDKRGRFEY
jgi:transcriptional regulator of heat shock response